MSETVLELVEVSKIFNEHSSNRLTILSLEIGFPSQEILHKLKENNFNFSKINGVNTLILY